MKNSLVVLFIVLAFSVSAQEQSGIVTYKGVTNQKFVDSFMIELKAKKDVTMAVKQKVAKWFETATPDEFKLNFKNGESYYYVIPKLETDGEYDAGSRADQAPYYTNNATDTIVGMTGTLGNIAHKSLDWEITNKTQKIGIYQCYGATVTEKLYSRKGGYYYRHVTAWFTLEIPLNFGPSYYKGLPGLILQIEREDFTLTAIELNLNPDKEIQIKRLDENDRVITEAQAYGRSKELEEDMKRKYKQ